MNVRNETVISNNTKRINAIQKHITAKTEIPINGEFLKPAAITALYQDSLDTHALADTKRGEYKAALKSRDAVSATCVAADECLKGWVFSRFGKNSPEAHDFGFSARKVPTLSAEAKAKAVLLNHATRKARGTLGKKEKLKIKGTLIVPAEPAAPAHAAEPVVIAPVAIAPTPTPTLTTAPVVIAPPPLAQGGGAALNGAAHN